MLKKTLKMTAFLSSLTIMIGMAKPINVDASTTYVKATANLNVRSGASTKYKTIDKIKKGNVVKVLSSKNGWYKVQLSNNKTGWSSQKYLSATNTTTTNTTSTTTNTNAVATATVNVRSGASTKYKVIDKLSKGEKVRVLSTSGSWYKVQFDGNKTGWSHKDYINTTNSSSSSNVSSSSNSSSSSMNVAKTLTVKSYAYTGGGYTAMGTKAKYGTLAVDPSVIPYGTKVYIKELDKVFTAEDCGGGIKGNKVDIYMNTQADCRNWGVRTITLQILK